MARTKPPSFDFFPDDFIAGTYHLPAEAVGIYVRLLCYQWNNGSIPSDETELARVAGVDANAMPKHMPPTSNVQLPASECYMSLSLLKIKHFEFLSKNTACPEWLAPMFCRWLAFRTARDGHPVDEVLQDTWTANLIARGQEKALADIDFSINKQAKNLLYSENDLDKVAKAKIEGATKPAGRETAAEAMRRMFEDK